MIDVNEILATFFQKRPEPDADGVYHYLLQEQNDALVIDITPYRQWTPEFLKNTLIISCEQNEVGLCWMDAGIYRSTLGGPLPIETILYQEDELSRRLVFVGLNIIARIDLPPDSLSFWIGSRDHFYETLYEAHNYRVLSP